MDKQPSHRYEIWKSNPNGQAPGGTSASAPGRLGAHAPGRLATPAPGRLAAPAPIKPVAASPKPIRRRDDLDASMLIYGYGLPIALALDGVCTLPGGTSAQCQTTKISSDSVNVVYAPSPPGAPKPVREAMPKGAAVNLKLDEVGAFRGTLTSQHNDGFEVAVDSAYQTVLGAKLSHIAAKRGIAPSPLPSIPIETRIEPSSKDCWFLDQTGTLRKGLIVNLSQVDMLLRASIIPPMGAQIVFRGARRYAAEVTSIFKIGFMVKFCNQLPVQEFTTAIKFSDI